MKDLIAKLHSDAADQILATFSTLEMQLQGFAKSSYEKDLRIAELEAQIAAASAPVVGQHGYEHQRAVLEGERNAAADAYFGARNHLEAAAHRRIFDAGFDRGFMARPILSSCTNNPPDQQNELRAWLSKLEDEVMPLHSDAKKLFTRVRTYLQACGYFTASTALQAPVREVPEGWQLVPIVSTSKMDRAGEDAYESRGHCDCGNAHGVSMEMVYDAMLAVAPLPAAPVQKEGE